MSDQHFHLIGQVVFVVLEYVSELMLIEIVLECEGSNRTSLSVSLWLPDASRSMFPPIATVGC